MDQLIGLVVGFLLLISPSESAIHDEEILSSYKPCTDHWLEYKGYTWFLKGSRKLWSHCGFPNPRHDLLQCGRSINTSRSHPFVVCDPDHVLTPFEITTVDHAAWRFGEQTTLQCSHPETLNFTAVFVVVENLRIPNLKTPEKVCINKCGEIHPTLDISKSSIIKGERDVALQSFAGTLAKEWDTRLCESSIIFMIWSQPKMAYTFVGKNVKKYVTALEVQRIHNKAEEYVQQGLFSKALLFVLDEYRAYLHENIPAYILLGIYAFILLLSILFLVFLFRGTDPFYYWKDITPLTPFKYIVKFLSCVYLIEYVMVGIMFFQYHVKYWHAAVVLVAFILLFCTLAVK